MAIFIFFFIIAVVFTVNIYCFYNPKKFVYILKKIRPDIIFSILFLDNTIK